ncbi:aldolase/citrate lyase family protein [Paraburkholderia aromaticivorans]|uniref:aldolase/citrate lyase family protein n=1 Tax=Paraburkholderia aromaticivorans TaxID=2026199 RepID=UPI003D67048B
MTSGEDAVESVRPRKRKTRMFPKSYLSVPGDRPERFAKAYSSGADPVTFDLEEAVAPAAKTRARDAYSIGSRIAAEGWYVSCGRNGVVRCGPRHTCRQPWITWPCSAESRKSAFAEDHRLSGRHGHPRRRWQAFWFCRVMAGEVVFEPDKYALADPMKKTQTPRKNACRRHRPSAKAPSLSA